MSVPTVSAWVILVHHKSLGTVGTTVRGLLAAGVRPGSLVVVDNSEDPACSASLRKLLPAESHLLEVDNRGYAAAVNRGVDALASLGGGAARHVLVSTHEAQPAANAIEYLERTLERDDRAAVAGPTLLDLAEERSGLIWSRGGYLSRLLRLPEHYGWGDSADLKVMSAEPIERMWLDGSFCMYRLDLLRQYRLDESFFMYFEETDLHLRLGLDGWKVLWVPAAQVGQSSNGIPPRSLGANLPRHLAKHGRRGFRHAAVLWVLFKIVLKVLLRRQPPTDLSQFIDGWIAAVVHREVAADANVRPGG